MNRRSMILAIVCPVLGSVLADTVHLKNGKTLSGLVLEETSENVVVDMGAGVITLERSKIESVSRGEAAEQESLTRTWQQRYFLHEKYLPPEYKEIMRAYRSVEDARLGAIHSRRRLSGLRRENDKLRERMARLEREHVGLHRRLSRADPSRAPQAYNELVASNNKATSRLVLLQADIEKNENLMQAHRKKLNEYAQVLSVFEQQFRSRFPTPPADTAEAHRLVYDHLVQQIERFSRDFANVRLKTSGERGGIVVMARINDRVSGMFLLDTGASLMTISHALARQLELPLDNARRLTMTLADGKQVDATPVVLGRVEVQGAGAEGVPAVVMSPPGEGLDGLLGMSFLREFIVNIDPADQSVVLRRFRPDANP